jgi:hypothetical protein
MVGTGVCDGVAVGAGSGGAVGFGAWVAGSGVSASGGRVGIVKESDSVGVALGVGGVNPELGVEVGRGDDGS